MDLTKYYELKQPHSSRYLMDSLGGLGPADVVGSKRDDFVAPPASCCSPVLATATSGVRRSKSPLRVQTCLSSIPAEEHSGIMMTHHFLDAVPPKTAVISGLDEQMNDHHLEELHMERWSEGNMRSCFIKYEVAHTDWPLLLGSTPFCPQKSVVLA